MGCQNDEGVKGASSLGAIMGGAREENEGKVAKVGTYQKLSKIVQTKGGNIIVVRYEEKMNARGRMREGRKERQKGREEERRTDGLARSLVQRVLGGVAGEGEEEGGGGGGWPCA